MTGNQEGLPRRDTEPPRTPEVPNIGGIVDKCDVFYSSILKPLADDPIREGPPLTLAEITERYSPVDRSSIKSLVGFDALLAMHKEMFEGSVDGEARREVSQDGYTGYAMTQKNGLDKDELIIDLKKPDEEGGSYSSRSVHYTVDRKREETKVEIIDKDSHQDKPERRILAHFDSDRHDFAFEFYNSPSKASAKCILSDDPDSGNVINGAVLSQTYRNDQPSFTELREKFKDPNS